MCKLPLDEKFPELGNISRRATTELPRLVRLSIAEQLRKRHIKIHVGRVRISGMGIVGEEIRLYMNEDAPPYPLLLEVGKALANSFFYSVESPTLKSLIMPGMRDSVEPFVKQFCITWLNALDRRRPGSAEEQVAEIIKNSSAGKESCVAK